MKLAITLFLSLYGLISHCQSLTSGIVTDNSGKAVQCFLPMYSQQTSKEIRFKLTENGEWQELPINKVDQIRYDNGVVLKRFDIKVEKSSPFFQDMQSTADPKWIEETVLLQLIVSGTYELYEYSDSYIQRYFYVDTSNENPQITQLVNIKFKEGFTIRESRKYIFQLMSLFKEQQDKYSTYKKIDYKKKEFVRLFLKKNGDKGVDLSKTGRSPSYFQTGVSLYGGARYLSFKVPSRQYSLFSVIDAGPDLPDYQVEDKYSWSRSDKISTVAFEAGFDFEVFFIGRIPNLAIIASPNLMFVKYSEKGKDYSVSSERYIDSIFVSSNNTTEKLDVGGKLGALNVPVGLKYYFINDATKKLGVSIQYNLLLPILDNSITYLSDMAPQRTQGKHEKSKGVTAGLDYGFKKIYLKASYTSFGTVGDETSGNWSSFGLALGYKIY